MGNGTLSVERAVIRGWTLWFPSPFDLQNLPCEETNANVSLSQRQSLVRKIAVSRPGVGQLGLGSQPETWLMRGVSKVSRLCGISIEMQTGNDK